VSDEQAVATARFASAVFDTVKPRIKAACEQVPDDYVEVFWLGFLSACAGAMAANMDFEKTQGAFEMALDVVKAARREGSIGDIH